MINVCIVGYGAIGPTHAKAITRTENARVYAICDINEERCARGVKEYGALEYHDFEEMLKNNDIDSVHICTPHYLHLEMIKKSLLAGKKVVCEKPVAMTRDEFKELLELENSEKLCIVFQNRLNPSIVKMKEIYDSGKLGKLITAKGYLTWYRTKEYYENDAWRGKYKTEGGGVLINQAVHTLDYFGYIIGKAVKVKAQMSNFSHSEIEVEDTVSAYMEFENGATGMFFATNSYGVNSSPEFELVFENDIMRYQDGKLKLNDEVIEEDIKGDAERSYWGNGHGGLIKRFYDENIYFTPKTAINTMNMMFDMYDSANGR